MVFFRRRGPPIITDKHEVTWSNLSQNASTAIAITLVLGVTASLKNAATEVLIGSKVKFIYLEFHFAAETITSAKVIHWIVEVLAANEGSTTSPANYYQIGRNHIIQRGMEMLPKDVSTVFKRIVPIRIPRGLQRISEGGTIRLRYVCSSAETINACGFAIYKENK